MTVSTAINYARAEMEKAHECLMVAPSKPNPADWIATAEVHNQIAEQYLQIAQLTLDYNERTYPDSSRIKGS